MRPRLRGGPSRRLLVLLLAITVVPLVSLLWLGRYLLEEDRAIAAKQAGERLDRAATLVAAAVDRAIAADEQRLAAGARDWSAGAVVVILAESRVSAAPALRLAFLPLAPALPEADARLFEPVDRAEFQSKDRTVARELLETLTASSDPAVRATARLQLARQFSSLGEHERALRIYEPLANVDTVALAGVPVGLVARYRRCQLLAALGRTAALRKEAATLHQDLLTGRWTVTAPVFVLYRRDADAWMGASDVHPGPEERMAGAVQALWEGRDRWPAGPGTSPRRFVLEAGGDTYSVLWQSRASDVRALVAAPEYVRANWLPGASALAREHGVTVHVSSFDGDPPPATDGSIVIPSATSRLPWALAVARHPTSAAPEATSRRLLLIIGLAVLITMALASSYFIARSVHREIAVARLQSDFVAAVSHEFRTPLTTLRQFTDMLREGGAADDPQRQVCYEAQARATDRLTRLVESVLDFGSMEAGKRRYRFDALSCAALVRAVVDDFRREVKAAGYHIECRATSQVEVVADAEALGRALRNLLENAVKYSPDSRTVDVIVTERDSTVAIAVRDRGIGVPPAERKAIFDQFHRGAEARTRGIAGTGIGLAMVDHIVRAHGGHVDVQSEPGQGSTFTIVLPMAMDRDAIGTSKFELRSSKLT